MQTGWKACSTFPATPATLNRSNVVDGRGRQARNDMKKLVFVVAMLSVLSIGVFGKGTQEIQMKVGEQKSADRGRLTIKFVSVVEDSRCPMNARCVWAGNAKIKIAVSKGKMAPKFVELNTGQKPDSVKLYGYTISLEGLSQNDPAMMGPFDRPLVATFSVSK